MIDKKGYLRCDACGRILGELKDNQLEILCSRSTCEKRTTFDIKREYQSHKLVALSGNK